MKMMMLAGFLAAACSHTLHAASQMQHADPHAAVPASPVISPREAGARYGQALGVALVCYALRTTTATERLPSAYTGTDREAFQAEADKVLKSWREASTCRKAGGANPCRLIHEWSCSTAYREIGPQGTSLPGLIDEK